jgi:DNA-binding MarR family transcriptional regulator
LQSPTAIAKEGAMAEEQARGLEWGQLGEGIGPLVRLLRIELTVRVANAQAKVGLHSGALSAMALIDANPGCSQSDLARELALDKSVLVAIVDDLEWQGMAVRTRSATDRRRNSLALTDQGRATMATMLDSAMDVERPIRDALSVDEYAALTGLLKRAYIALQPGEDPPAGARAHL